MIALIGANGSMGKRYQAIFNYLKLDFMPMDQDLSPEAIIERAAACDRILIASPTHTHVSFLRELLPTKKPILCEKPVTKDLEELREIHAFCKRAGLTYNMVMQYAQLQYGYSGPSSYNYFRHGNDGLAWDCIQILALANGPVELKDDSPIWRCRINGIQLDIASMDMAYISMIQKWLIGDLCQTLDEILAAHERVIKYKGLLDEPAN